jgi:hypothetical protein
MNRKRTLLIFCALAVAGSSAFWHLWLRRQVEIDSCLDGGGCWSRDRDACINPTSSEPEEIQRAQLQCSPGAAN